MSNLDVIRAELFDAFIARLEAPTPGMPKLDALLRRPSPFASEGDK